MSDDPRFTVAIPFYNRADYIGRTFESLFAQTVAPESFEIVVVDDGSTDEAIGALSPYLDRVSLRRNAQNLGLVGNWNRCIQATRGRYLLILHSDDTIAPTYMEEMGAVLDSEPSVDLVVCRCSVIDARGAEIGTQSTVFESAGIVSNAVRQLLSGSKILTPGALVRRSFYSRCGMYDPEFAFAPDFEMWLRIATRGRIYFLDRCLAHWRQHDTNLTLDCIRECHDILELPRFFSKYKGASGMTSAQCRSILQAYIREEALTALAFLSVGDHDTSAMRLERLAQSSVVGELQARLLASAARMCRKRKSYYLMLPVFLLLRTRRWTRWITCRPPAQLPS